MGSLAASGIAVVAKTDTTYRKRDVLITEANSNNDTVASLVTAAPIRTITSGSIVRDNGLTSTVEYYEDLVWGVTRMGRTCLERVASDESCTRQNVVTLPNGSGTIAVIEEGLTPHIPQISHRHTGERVVETQSTDDSIVRRVLSSGVYD